MNNKSSKFSPGFLQKAASRHAHAHRYACSRRYYQYLPDAAAEQRMSEGLNPFWP